MLLVFEITQPHDLHRIKSKQTQHDPQWLLLFSGMLYTCFIFIYYTNRIPRLAYCCLPGILNMCFIFIYYTNRIPRLAYCCLPGYVIHFYNWLQKLIPQHKGIYKTEFKPEENMSWAYGTDKSTYFQWTKEPEYDPCSFSLSFVCFFCLHLFSTKQKVRNYSQIFQNGQI